MFTIMHKDLIIGAKYWILNFEDNKLSQDIGLPKGYEYMGRFCPDINKQYFVFKSLETKKDLKIYYKQDLKIYYTPGYKDKGYSSYSYIIGLKQSAILTQLVNNLSITKDIKMRRKIRDYLSFVNSLHPEILI